MRTFFDIVLGILLTVLKACLHTLVSAVGVLAFCAMLLFAAVYAWRRRSRRAEARKPISIER